jgi:LmbE family N-acetylglucosaminyl deacetylase
MTQTMFKLVFFVAILAMNIFAAEDALRIIVIGAHPDDADVKAGGTAALWAEMGHHVKFVSMTNGDAGHQSEGGGALAKRRRAEAAEAGRRLSIDEYITIDNHDAELLPSLEVRHQIIRMIREWDADLVITHRTNDYHPDHRYTGQAVQDAAYLVIVPNVCPDTPPTKKNPVFMYMYDHFQYPYPFKPDMAVGIDNVLDKKVAAIDAHESQMYEWIPWTQHAVDAVPETKKERLEWIKKRWTNRQISEETRETLIKWYGKKTGSKVKNVEVFQVCEYGHQPTDEELKKLFPMVKVNY